MIRKVQQYIEQYHMIDRQDKIVVGVSGGADSVCLLFVLLELQKKIPFSLFVVHVNHKMREEAMEDANYVKGLCRENHIPYFLVEEDVEALAKKMHLSSEEAGRKVRYEAFERVCLEQGATKIAVAHNKNDRAETVLFNLFRGSSIRGLNGIAPVRGQIIRPLLCVERTEIEAYLQKREIPYCTDKTNGEDIYTRNKIRNHILPYVEENIVDHVVTHISDTAQMVSEAEEYLQKQTHRAYEMLVTTQQPADAACIAYEGMENGHIEQEKRVWIQVSGFLTLDRIIQKYLLMECIHELAGSRKDITSRHVQDLLELFHKSVSKGIHLPYQLSAVREYEYVRITKQLGEHPWDRKETITPQIPSIMETDKKTDNRTGGSKNTEAIQEQEINMEECKEKGMQTMEIPGLGNMEIRVFPYRKCEVIPEKTYTKWFDYDKIVKSLLVRHRRTGDYLSINETGNTKTLKAYMIDEKIPKEVRDHLYVLASGSHIVWLIGYRISQAYKVDENTKEILEVKCNYIGGKENGRTH